MCEYMVFHAEDLVRIELHYTAQLEHHNMPAHSIFYMCVSLSSNSHTTHTSESDIQRKAINVRSITRYLGTILKFQSLIKIELESRYSVSKSNARHSAIRHSKSLQKGILVGSYALYSLISVIASQRMILLWLSQSLKSCWIT